MFATRLAVSITCVLVACHEPTPEPTTEPTPDAPPVVRERVPVGLNIIPLNYETSRPAWRQVFDAANAAGVDLVSLYAPSWKELETSPGSYHWDTSLDFFAELDAHAFAQRTLDVSTPVGWTTEELPLDLVFTAFDEPQVIARYKAYVGEVIGRFRTGLTHVILHTEGAPTYFAEHPDRLAGYCTLIAEATAHIHATFPGVRVGAYQADGDAAPIACLVSPMDFFTAALTCDGQKPNSDLRAQLDRGLALAAGKPVVFNEASCATSAYLGSSESLQTATIRELFEFLDAHPTSIELAAVYTVFDEDKTITRGWVDATFPDWPQELRDGLVEWASSLGLRTHLDVAKPGWNELVARIAAPSVGEVE